LNKKPCKTHREPTLECDFCTHPVMSPYFVFGRDAAGETLRQMFGDQCSALPVAFPSDDLSEFGRRNFEEWGYGTLKCRGNGEIAQALVDVKEYAKYQAASAKATE